MIDRSHALRSTIRAGLVLSAAGIFSTSAATPTLAQDASRWEIVAVEALPEGSPNRDRAELIVDVVGIDDADKTEPIPFRAIVTDATGARVDGSGRGTYSDGRFFAEGSFEVALAPGEAKIELSAGPHVEPLTTNATLEAGKRVRARATLRKRFHPASIGWYGGDNHVHTQHDRTVAVRVDPAYTALQARANGLNFVTEADPGHEALADGRHDTESFLYRTAPEIRPGPFVGHYNTPGIERPLPQSRLDDAFSRPLPGRQIHAAVKEFGGALIATHPFTPPHQIHWMGAGECWSDAALGQHADLFDLDSPMSETLWFAMLNLGCRIGASGYTDCALGRASTPTPGDRRVYCRADSLDYEQIVASMREGRTVATDGGPVFTTLSVAGREIGETISLDDVADAKQVPVRVKVWCDVPLAGVGVFCGGERILAFDGKRQTGALEFEATIDLSKAPGDWFVAKAESDAGRWAVTSPIYLERNAEEKEEASGIVFGIGNYTRYVELRKDFFAHGAVTVRPPEGLSEVRLLRDGETIASFDPESGERIVDGKTPVTGASGEYAKGWAWHREQGQPCHLQFDWPVADAGWYAVEATTTDGRKLSSEAIRFDVNEGNSFAIASARLDGPATSLVYRGYGEEMPLAEISLPFEGDHWWYGRSSWWSLKAKLHGATRDFSAGNSSAEKRFRATD